MRKRLIETWAEDGSWARSILSEECFYFFSLSVAVAVISPVRLRSWVQFVNRHIYELADKKGKKNEINTQTRDKNDEKRTHKK